MTLRDCGVVRLPEPAPAKCDSCGETFRREVLETDFWIYEGNIDGLFYDRDGKLRHVCNALSDLPDEAFFGPRSGSFDTHGTAREAGSVTTP